MSSVLEGIGRHRRSSHPARQPESYRTVISLTFAAGSIGYRAAGREFESATTRRLECRRTIHSLESKAMCDLVYLNLLREKVRQLEAKDQRAVASGPTPHERFVPWTLPTRSR